ncbi:Asp-tRNA(Asn)/Glu-tRNA(Gln) amidotransferase GatCAB subunit C [candidate division WWE3 bacterium]|nr:Asp-tRNA(Asn)/Glu-tRNA(Gln) amidotransferase GatCAB subunit C [candidate division WWE3 bacterium]
MQAAVTHETVQKVAKLCNLTLTQEEISKFSIFFTDTLKYMDMLGELDTSKIKETYQVTGLTNIFQNGDSVKSLSVEQALSNASENINNYFGTKAVFDRK